MTDIAFDSVPAPQAAPRRAPTFGQLLATGTRIAALRRVAPDSLDATWLQIAAMVLATLVPPVIYASINIGADGHVAWMLLPQVLFHVPVMLLACAVLAHVGRRGDRVAPLLGGALLAWTWIDFVALGIWLPLKMVLDDTFALAMGFHWVPLLWLALAVARLAASLAILPVRRAALVFVLALLMLSLPLGAVYRERSIWSMDYSRQAGSGSDRSRMMAAATEESFYRQPEILQRALAAVQPGREGVVDLYLIGMAGYGHQDVFMREVNSVDALFRERFDAAGRTVKLVNNPATVLEQPVASATSLRAALQRVGAAMNAEEDVLVLFLTSHGSSTHEFTVQLWPLELKQITPPMLREMLDASGVRNRVVIVSACYAGGFVKDLADENTLVIAAAAPDRNSFGCSNENDWTYFGKAYFDEALRQTTSFTRAFELAKPRIEERERSEDFEPSNPQMLVGAAIKGKLEALERQQATR